MQVGDYLTEESRALAWWQNASDTLISEFSTFVLAMEESTDLKHLHDTFIKPPPASCNAAQANQVTKVTFDQVKLSRRFLKSDSADASLFGDERLQYVRRLVAKMTCRCAPLW